jgi:hypothetical protein
MDNLNACMNTRCRNDASKHDEYCQSCHNHYECESCNEVLPDENDWNEVKLESKYIFICTKCFQKKLDNGSAR